MVVWGKPEEWLQVPVVARSRVSFYSGLALVRDLLSSSSEVCYRAVHVAAERRAHWKSQVVVTIGGTEKELDLDGSSRNGNVKPAGSDN